MSIRCRRTRRSAACRPAASSRTRSSARSSAIPKASWRGSSSTSSHQVVFVPGDTAFNESFASTVEKIGEARWLAEHAGPEARAAADAAQARRADFRAITTRFRDELARVYASAARDDEKRAGKAAVLARLRDEYATLKTTRWGGYAGYDGWFASANNASFAVLASYTGLVPAFERIYEREGRDFARFYAEVRRIAALPAAERTDALAR